MTLKRLQDTTGSSLFVFLKHSSTPGAPVRPHLEQRTFRLKVTAGQVVVVSFVADGSGNLKVDGVFDSFDDLKDGRVTR